MMNTDTIVQLLQGLKTADTQTRQTAEKMYKQAKEQEPDLLMANMIKLLGTQGVDEEVRKYDAVLLRRLVLKTDESFVFGRLTQNIKEEIAAELLRRFEQEPSVKMQKKIGEVIAQLADYVCDPLDRSGSLQPSDPTGWPGLLQMVFRMSDSANTPPEACEAALTLLRGLVPTLNKSICAERQILGQALQTALSHTSLKIKVAAALLIYTIVETAEKTAWAPLLATTGVLMQVLQQVAQAKEEELLQELVQEMIDVAQTEPDFFKQQLQADLQPAKTFAEIAKVRDGTFEPKLRVECIEWLVTYTEKRTKWLTKHIPNFIPLTMEVCMEAMTEVEDGEEATKAWAARMDDEEGEEDEDELFQEGQECIDRVAHALEDLGTALFKLIGHFSQQPHWQAKHAALCAIKQTIEYVDDKPAVDELAQMLLAHMEHPHPRVRYTALHALGQMGNDQQPHFQEKWHQTLMAVILARMDDPVDRVAAMSMSAFVSVAQALDNSLLITYSSGFMEKLVNKLRTSKHRGVQEESITSIAVIAGVIEKDFGTYYDGMMPMLQEFLANATGEKENRLRGKAFECMSLLAIAVGKEKFLPYAQHAIGEMIKIPLEADDLQREYIKDASERICHCLKKDFAPFLPAFLPGIFNAIRLEEDSKPAATSGGADDDDEYIQVMTGEGKTVRVHSRKFEELVQNVQLLNSFCSEMEGAYYDYVQPTAEVLLPLLSASDEVSMLCDEARGEALQTWGLLIKCATIGAKERGQPNTIAPTLLQTGLQQTFAQMAKNPDAEILSPTASGITECIKNAGPGVFGSQEVVQLTEKIFGLIDESLVRSQKVDKEKQESKRQEQGLPGDDEDDEEDAAEAEEEQCRRNFVEVLGAIMKVNPAEFMQVLPKCAEILRAWLTVAMTKVLALYLACDILEHLREQSVSIWPVFMEQVFAALTDKDPDLRTAGAYAINLAAPLQEFTRVAPDAYRRLAAIISAPKPKKREEKAKMARDNAVAAMLALCKDQSGSCPPEIQSWSLTLGCLPMWDDEDEAKKVHDRLVDLVLEQNQGLLGANQGNLPVILSVLAEVYHVEDVCTEETEAKILRVFKNIPTELLKNCAGQFTEKQQKKIEKMLSS